MKKMNFLLFASSAVVSSVIFSQHSTTNAVNFDISSPSNFINSIAPHAKKLGEERNLYASIMIAQAALESGYGKSELAQNANNIFGVKEKNGGPSYVIASDEYDEDEVLHSEVSAFKVFDSHLAALEYYTGHFTQTQWYTDFYKGIHRSESPSYKEALQTLDGKYATDPNYVVKLQKLIDTYNLTQYDAPSTYVPPVEEPIEEENPAEEIIPSSPQEKEGYYTIKVGDSLRDVAVSFGINIYDLLEWNSLASEVVEPNTTIIVDKNLAPNKTASTVKDIYGNTIHTILKGESFHTLSKLYKVTEQDILSWNNISKTNFYVGQKIIVKKSTNVHIVQKGETLYKISTTYKIPVSDIVTVNNIKDNIIKVGQNLIIEKAPVVITPPVVEIPKPAVPTPPINTVKPSTPPKVTTTTKTTTYKVVKGDTLYKISKKFNTTTKKVQILNNMKDTNIKVGQSLVVKKETVTTTSPSNNNTSNNSSNNSASKPSTSTTSKITSYKVVKGDTLIKIAKKYNTNVKNIQSLNNLKNTTIKPGQSLIVKKEVVSSNNTSNNKSYTNSSSNSSIQYYTVVKGDNLTKISSKYKTTVAQLKKLNNLKSNTISIGQKLRIK